MLNTVEPDDCCCKKLVKQLGSGKVSGDVWTCPKCGLEWRREVYPLPNGEGISHWRPHPVIMLIE